MNLSEQIHSLARKYESYTAQNLSKLVKVKSLSTTEKEVSELIVTLMKEAGFDEARVDGLGNAVGRIGNGKKVIAIDGHIDTVDTGNLQNWDKDPFSGEISDGYVYGRGTVDQKSGVAAFITAGRILKEVGVPEDVTVYFTGTVMEEDCDGLCWKYLVEEEKIRPDFAIITEPTDCKVYRGHRGRMEIEVSFTGVSSHGSAPERGKNAIYMASRACLAIEQLNERLMFDPFLGKGTVTVTEFVSGSPSLCAVADFAKIHLDRRLTWGEDKELAVAQIEEIVKEFGAKVEVLQYSEKGFTGREYGMEKYYPTWKLEESEHVVQIADKTYTDLFSTRPVIDKWTFSTNGIMINGVYKIPSIGFGPGNEALAHAPNEKVPVEDLVKASAFYAYFCQII
ncbi:MAG: YgeY family selenium metabolism-linked hydrolase [Ignavibacteria bacterium]|nr:YgeY family selenium metabolism-linked hydrolase [Ignavibacteria bacterium]